MTVMHIDFRIPIVPNGSCYGSDFEVFEIFFELTNQSLEFIII